MRDHLFDLLGAGAGLLRKGLDLGCHDGKPAAVFPGPGRLYGCIQGQQVGLVGKVADETDDLADVGHLFADLHGRVPKRDNPD